MPLVYYINISSTYMMIDKNLPTKLKQGLNWWFQIKEMRVNLIILCSNSTSHSFWCKKWTERVFWMNELKSENGDGASREYLNKHSTDGEHISVILETNTSMEFVILSLKECRLLLWAKKFQMNVVAIVFVFAIKWFSLFIQITSYFIATSNTLH